METEESESWAQAPPQIMTTSEVAALLRVSPRKVQLMAMAKEIPCMRIGVLYRFSRQSIMQLLKDGGL